jgi:tetratricopeptide (TPR) repeat protein
MRPRVPQAQARIAVLRCENLSPDPRQDWMGRALAEILSAQLGAAGAEPVVPPATIRANAVAMASGPAQAPGISAEREAALAAGANRLIACDFSIAGSGVRVSAVERDVTTEKNIRQAAAEGSLLAAADSLAHQLSARVAPSPTYAEGIEAPDPDAMHAGFARAVAADPNFSLAYMAWAQADAARHDREGVDRVVALADAHRDAFSAYDRARLDLLAAELHGDLPARARALAALAKTGPPDAAIYRSLAEIALGGRRYREAVNYYRQAVALAPADAATLNALGYAQAYLGDYDGALGALRDYQTLRPNEANPLDSQGDVNFYFNRYADAEKLYLAAHQKDPNFLGGSDLWKAALAHLATGDIAGADAIFGKYAAILDERHDPGSLYQKASWQYLTGRRREAVAMLDQGGKQGGALSRVYDAQLAIWLLESGDADNALRRARQAVSALPQEAREIPQLAPIAVFLTQPVESSPADLEARARHMFGPAAGRFAGYALLFHRRFAEALPLLRHAWEESNPTTEQGLPVLLAWAMIESGKWDGVTPLIGPSPVPTVGDPMISLYFPRLFYLRGRLAGHQSKRGQAVQNYQLFLKLAGSQPDLWNDQQRAKEAMAAFR